MCVVVFDADRDQVPVFTVFGRVGVGEAANPDAIADLIDVWENGGPR
ncbi:hypothetical protein QCN29_20720 [Streptomyces sp. HNM0663]|uniref:Uncharacterized protein n=1 Tax=Streptomyces chengmaiensis TaxID=3040919 RepID=A0ABT6HR24_9ACTN|nr:hypothetical protein [Streptomyces chengmaiensis]MDH2391169.1 hypothetical protein [Streptomyces chengmaiensis]